ncbi:MAG: type I-F CRISPR-associated protein Csy2 [Chlamydiae bacterium]|nr:type I-F CRISPR-associated protein Csy2 [Chlamydiota bacterium]
MKSLLILPKIVVENANAIAGLTYGFPGICNFTGFTHALSRELKDRGVELGGCAVVCHRFKVHAHEVGGFYKSFSQSRFPLNEKGKTAPIIQEGKMHMTVSLIISCNFTAEDLDFGTMNVTDDRLEFEKFIQESVYKKTLAGGFIKDLKRPKFIEIASEEFSLKKELRKLLPGFLIKDRSDDFKKYLESEDKNDPLTSWLGCFTMRHKSQKSFENEVEKCDWSVEKKPLPGWIVPVQIGYKSLSKVFAAGEVKYSRDISTPFCFVEPIYSIAEWISPHRVEDIEDLKSLFWDFCTAKNYYYCKSKKFKNQG